VEWDGARRRRRGVPEQVVAEEAGVARAALRVEDPQLGGASRWSEPVARDGHLRPLPDDVTPEPDPVASRELEPKAGGLGDGRGQPLPHIDGLEHDEQGPGAPRQGRESSQPVADPHALDRGIPGLRQVDEQQVDGPRGEQCRRQR
jgi:hypothetical protein